MTEHPLTDETCLELSGFTLDDPDYGVEWLREDMRAAYDLAIAHFSKWIYENGAEYFIQHHEHNIKTDLDTIVADFRKSMRPTQQEDN